MSDIVSYSMAGDIAVVNINSPPVNAVDQSVRAGLKQAFTELRGKPGITAIVLACAGRTFVAGADIKEFDTGIAAPGYHEILRLIEDSPVPVIAAVHGTALAPGPKLPSAVITALPTRQRASACRNFRWASFPGPAAPSACRVSWRLRWRST